MMTTATEDKPFTFRCKTCGLKCTMRPSEFPIHCSCGMYQEARNMPQVPPIDEATQQSLAKLGMRYTVAVGKWLLHGAPARSDDEVAELLTICQACPGGHYKNGRCSHKKCGCSVNDGGSGFTNMLRMATEHCPIGEWGVKPSESNQSTEQGFPA